MVDKPDSGAGGEARRPGREPHSGEGAASAMREMRQRNLAPAREEKPAARQSGAWHTHQDSSVRLFQAWAAKHKHLIELEDGLTQEHQRVDAERLRQVRDEADRLREAALAAFQRELEERGLRQAIKPDSSEPA